MTYGNNTDETKLTVRKNKLEKDLSLYQRKYKSECTKNIHNLKRVQQTIKDLFKEFNARHFQQYFSYFVVINFILENRSC
jgi:hypothetical protein